MDVFVIKNDYTHMPVYDWKNLVFVSLKFRLFAVSTGWHAEFLSKAS